MENKKAIIYCYTGTGNSLEVAKTISAKLGNTTITSMSNTKNDILVTNYDIIGFVFPVHHWNMPNRVRMFVSHMSINTNAYIFAIAACGGIAVNTLNDFNKLIIAKGARLSYSCVHKNVSSYIVAYERFPNPDIQICKSTEALKSIIEDIKNRAYKEAPKSNPIKYLLKMLMFNITSKFPNKDKSYVVSDKCVGCRRCARICPAKNIIIIDGQPSFQHKCEQCMSCIQYCPVEAINYKNRTQKRKRYHHPNISADELAFFNSHMQ